MDVQFLILAAGKGKRMNNAELPKVLVGLHGRPLIRHLLDSVHNVPSQYAPVVVVGHKAELVRAELGNAYLYATQHELLGTGHAVMSAKDLVTAPYVMVVNGDTPFVSSEFLTKLASAMVDGSVMAMGTIALEDYSDWRSAYLSHGRIIRDESGRVIAIREYKDASETERTIREVNLGFYIFKTDWMYDQLANIDNRNAQGEYYLTDLVALALASGHEVPTVAIGPIEGLGINSVEHLEQAAVLVQPKFQLVLE
jgi:bifunctional UDP-N-acetylglucosamine pyrophosphorylase / glucosamine-1-phosphate N-acetyltransferase